MDGVGGTALGMARVRAAESLRPDRLFDDPYAAALSGEQQVTDTQASALAFHGVIRTRFYDEYLLAAGCRQVVLLAAGLDTRAFRLPWPDGVRLFELDLPEVLAYKEEILTAQPACDRTVLAIDLREDWPTALVGAGFDPAEPTAWLAEGLLIYLTAEEAGQLLTSVGDLSAPGSQIAFERNNTGAARATDSPGMRRYTSLWKGGLGQDAAEWLTAHGWRPETHDLTTLAASYGRTAPEKSRSGFVTAKYHAG